VREVIVVDNASSDGSPQMVESEFPEVTLIRSKENLGFAKANNLGMGHANGSMLALVNSDVVLLPGCLEMLAGFLENHEGVGLVGPRVVGSDGRVQRTCRRRPTLWNNLCRTLALDRILSNWAVFSGYEMRHLGHDLLSEAEVLSGCFWMARREAGDAVGRLDDRFFFYMEDVDWSRRFWKAGWKVMFIADAVAIHHGGGSTSNAPHRYSIELHRANLQYWEKYHGALGKGVYFCIAALHHLLRFVVRGSKRALGLGTSTESMHKLREDVVCLRWLLTGRGV
jgi:GT2 family glycosyltransferase